MNPPTPQHDLATQYQVLRRGLLSYLRKQVTDPAVAEDLLHEIFLKALAANQQGTSATNLSAWLYTIARNTVIDFYRAKRPMAELPENLAEADPADNLSEQALAECLRPLIEQLPRLYRDTLLAADLQHKTLQSLATELNVSLSALKSRASRGRKMLKEKLLACCAVEVSTAGQVVDFHPRQPNSICSPNKNCR